MTLRLHVINAWVTSHTYSLVDGRWWCDVSRRQFVEGSVTSQAASSLITRNLARLRQEDKNEIDQLLKKKKTILSVLL